MSKLMKIFTAVLLSAAMALALVGCGSSEANTNANSSSQNTSDNADKITNMDSSKILVAYFSATHNTQYVADYIAGYLHASTFRIVPEQEYTADDLNYQDEQSRAYIENEENAKPALKYKLDNPDQYDVIFLGYPIWLNNAPGVIRTFLSEYDFAGKVIIPFCTSSSSGIKNSVTQIEGLTVGATWMGGMRFAPDATPEEVQSWLNTVSFKMPTGVGNQTSGSESGNSTSGEASRGSANTAG